MALLGFQYGLPYTLTSAETGVTAEFNNAASGNYAGVLANISGLDSPEIRENYVDRAMGPGAVHSTFYAGRRPVVFDIQLATSSPTTRDAMFDKIRLAARSMEEDAQLVWTPTGGVQRGLWLRQNQPLRISGGFMKSVQLAMIAEDPWIASTTESASSIDTGGSPMSISFTTAGDAPGPAHILVKGPAVDFTVVHTAPDATVSQLYFPGTVASTHTLKIDLARGRVYYDTHAAIAAGSTTSGEALISHAGSYWFSFDQAGTQQITATGSSMTVASTLQAKWNDSWQ